MKTGIQEEIMDRPVQIQAGSVTLEGNLAMPPAAKGIVLFAHGSGSGRHSSRNRFVARTLQEGGLTTLLFDLLTADEEVIDLQTRQLRFDIPLLAGRVIAATDWWLRQPEGQGLAVGYFGASTGAAAALIAAAERPRVVKAVVSRGGRPDLALPVLGRVQAPTLLIVGSHDYPVIEMNQTALAHLHAEKKLELIPGATHLFEEPSTLAQAAQLALRWFQRYLV
jgi:putative phosphoribosyl transferase